MNHDDILHAFYASNDATGAPHLIYIAIGCGMSAHSYGSHSPQQYPPQIAAWPGRKVCVLIDERFEAPPLYVFRDHGAPDLSPAHSINIIGDTTFITIQRRWGWKNPADHNQIHTLCNVAIHSPHTYMIVQDYTGEDPTPYYPLQSFGRPLLDKVLFDMTYSRFGGECFIDFSKIDIRRAPTTGHFLQPRFQALSAFWRDMDPDMLREELERRYSIATYTVYPHYLELRGRLEPKPWRSAEVLSRTMLPMCYTYGIRYADLTVDNLQSFLCSAILDFTAAIESPMELIDLIRIIDAPERESIPHVLGVAKALMLDMRSPPPTAMAIDTEKGSEITPP
jgi:hypothetical protein